MTRMYSARSGTGDVGEPLEGAAVRPVRVHRAHVVETVGERHYLQVGAVLGHLLEAAVQVADHRLDLRDDLAVEVHDHAAHAVRGRVRRSHVHDQLLDLAAVLADHVATLFDLQWHRTPPFVTLLPSPIGGGGRAVRRSDVVGPTNDPLVGVVLSQREAHPVLGQQDPSQVRDGPRTGYRTGRRPRAPASRRPARCRTPRQPSARSAARSQRTVAAIDSERDSSW